MKKRESVSLLVLAMSLVMSPCANAEWAKNQAATLKGIESLYVVIYNLDPDAPTVGLTSSMLRKNIELKLKAAGITVPLEMIGNDEPYLNVVINLQYDTSNDFVYYSFNVSLIQPVVLLRDANLSCSARTWFISSTGGAPKKESVRLMNDEINKRVDQFINDYRAVNPKKTMEKGG